MVTKQVLIIDKRVSSTSPVAVSVEHLLRYNVFLQHVLTRYKNKITEHYKNKLWDRYKKLANEYELIFTTPNTGSNISLYCPVSRSFFKMWEILHDFKSEIGLSNTPINAMFLAEGPGGFAEAFVKLRNGLGDSCYGISLKSANKNVPEWRYQQGVTVCYGADGTGDLYNKANLDYMSDNLPKMHLITADGGFDFSNDFNGQEESSIKLILCEIYSAFVLQEEGGSLVLKIYDMFHEHTLKIVSLLKIYYENIYIVKPLSSRPANSEKYLVCTGFSMSDASTLFALGNLVGQYGDVALNEFFNSIQHNAGVLHGLVSYNVYYTLRQAYYIEQTICYINDFGKNYHDERVRSQIKSISDKNKQKSSRWCEKYGLEHS
jgi:hypothetical protein